MALKSLYIATDGLLKNSSLSIATLGFLQPITAAINEYYTDVIRFTLSVFNKVIFNVER